MQLWLIKLILYRITNKFILFINLILIFKNILIRHLLYRHIITASFSLVYSIKQSLTSLLVVAKAIFVAKEI